MPSSVPPGALKLPLTVIASLLLGAFSAGSAVFAWQNSHPTRTEIALALGCEHALADKDSCPCAKDAHEARREAMRLQEQERALRRALAAYAEDVSRGMPAHEAMTRALRDIAPEDP